MSGRMRLLMQMAEGDDPDERLQAVLACKDEALDSAHATRLLLDRLARNDSDARVREFAALGLGLRHVPGPDPAVDRAVAAALARALESEPSDDARAAAAAAVGYLGDDGFVEQLIMLLYEDTSGPVRGAAAVALGMLRSQRAFSALVDGLGMDRPGSFDMARACIGALGELGDVRAVPHVLRFSRSDDCVTHQILAKALGNLPCGEAERALQFLMHEEHPNVRIAAHQARQQLAIRTALKTLRI